MNYSTLSAILRGKWLIDRNYAESQLPFIVGMLKNHSGSFSYNGNAERGDNFGNTPEPKFIAAVKGAQVYRVNPNTNLGNIPSGSIAFVDMIGPVVKYGGMCSYGAVDKANLLRSIDSSPNITGVILNVDSPGGQVDGTTLLADQVKAMTKPIVAMVDDGMMASAAMWIGSAANEIYATKSSDSFGSIGVYATLYDWNSYFKAEGLPVHEIYAPQSTEKNKEYRDAMSGDYSGMKSDLSMIADSFIQTIEANRPAASASKDQWSHGAMFYAKDAKKMGLIDGVKSFDQVVARVTQLAKTSKNNPTNMQANEQAAFPDTLKAASAESFEVVDGGFLLTEENLNAIEAKLAEAERKYAEAITANEGLTAQLGAEQDALAQAKATIEASTTQVNDLQAELTKVKNMTGGVVIPQKDADEFSAEEDPKKKYFTSVDAEMKRRRDLMKK